MVFIMWSELAMGRQQENFPSHTSDTLWGAPNMCCEDFSDTKATFQPMIFIFWKVLLNSYGGHKAYMSISDLLNIRVIYSAPSPHIFLDFLALWTLPIAFSFEHFWVENALRNLALDTCLPEVLWHTAALTATVGLCPVCGQDPRHPDLGILTSLPLLVHCCLMRYRLEPCITLGVHVPKWHYLLRVGEIWGSWPVLICGPQKEFSIWPDLVTSYGQHRCEIK